MSNSDNADLIFCCAELVEISARIDALRGDSGGDAEGGDAEVGDVRAELDVLEVCRDELLEELRLRPAMTLRGLRAKASLRTALNHGAGPDLPHMDLPHTNILNTKTLRCALAVLRGG